MPFLFAGQGLLTVKYRTASVGSAIGLDLNDRMKWRTIAGQA